MKVEKCLFCSSNNLNKITVRSDGVAILECSDCGLMMVERLSDNTEELYTSKYFEKKDKDAKIGYDGYLTAPAANLIGKYAFGRLIVREPTTHLDLGCADGSLMELYLEAGFTSFGLEISDDAVLIAQTKGLNVQPSNLKVFPKSTKKFFLITAYDLLEHLSTVKETLLEINRHLEAGGYFVFSTLLVKQKNSKDYWFNNSLEHYLYFNQENLSRILTDIFGSKSFEIIKIVNNGIPEILGIIKKGKIKNEKSIVGLIEDSGYNKADLSESYLLSLFYNQVSRFSESKKIIDALRSSWAPEKYIQARFYNNYFQGRFELAINELKNTRQYVSAENGIFWQALSHAEDKLLQIRTDEYSGEVKKNEAFSKRAYELNEELEQLKNSLLIGIAIRAREKVRDVKHSRARRHPDK